MILGVAGAMFSGRLLEGLVEGATLLNATTWAAEMLAITAVAAAAIWAATRPIARLNVTEILRVE